MSKSQTLKPLAIALGTAFTASWAMADVAPTDNPFAMTELSSGYQVASHQATQEAEGEKAKEGKCGEGKCGSKKAEEKAKEGKCGEGKCGSKK